ncbi:MAG TPA: GntR family transcriptional regulator [Spirochaetia bacterium]|nr:GntR family transcriptional regulator [Spirochaetia bacterium]
MGLLGGNTFVFDERIPYYIQLKSVLEEKIEKRELRPGDKLPSEAEICGEFQVSRTVVRQALKDMEYSGLIRKRKGKGTFVSEPKVLESFVQELGGFYQDMTAQHRVTRSEVVRLEAVQVSTRIAKVLRLRGNAKVVLLERVRFVDEIPFQLVTSYLPYKLCPSLLDADFANRSLYRFLEEQGIFLARGYRTIEAVQATDEDARRLAIEPGAPLIRIESIGYTEDGTPVEYYDAVHRGDRARFRVELVRKRVRESPNETGIGPGIVSLSGMEVLPALGSRKGTPKGRDSSTSGSGRK